MTAERKKCGSCMDSLRDERVGLKLQDAPDLCDAQRMTHGTVSGRHDRFRLDAPDVAARVRHKAVAALLQRAGFAAVSDDAVCPDRPGERQFCKDAQRRLMRRKRIYT